MRNQAVITRDGDHYFVECLCGNTPMTVNGDPMTGRVPLDSGAEIDFAGQHFTFEGEGVAGSSPTSVMAAPKWSLASPQPRRHPRPPHRSFGEPYDLFAPPLFPRLIPALCCNSSIGVRR